MCASWIRGHDAHARTVPYLRSVRLSREALSLRCRRRVPDQLEEDKARIKSLRVVAVSHLPWRSLLGLPGLLMMRAQVPEVGPLTILGPSGIERFIRQIHESLAFFLNYPLFFVEWNEGCPEVSL